MSQKNGGVKQQGSKSDILLWLLVLIVLVGGIVANSYYTQVAWALRAAGAIVVAIVAIALAAATVKGKAAWGFIKGSRAELRKVVWPTRQETVQTTLLVVALVLITAVILWGLDSLFLWAVGWVTGHRG